jgi:hypothetical protein
VSTKQSTPGFASEAVDGGSAAPDLLLLLLLRQPK